MERWQKTEPGELSSYFHALIDEGSTGTNFQFVKGRIFHLDDLDSLRKIEIEQMFIWMGLKEFAKDTINFEPIIQVTFNRNGKVESAYFECQDTLLELNQTEPVPTPFVNNTSKLWLDQQSDQLCDMFTVTTPVGIQRVRFFRVEGAGLDIIKGQLSRAVAFNIIPGLDYNKLANPEDCVFIPIINIQTPNLSDCGLDDLTNGHLHGVGWSIVEDGDDDTFLDFSNPCPPLCYPPPPPGD